MLDVFDQWMRRQSEGSREGEVPAGCSECGNGLTNW